MTTSNETSWRAIAARRAGSTPDRGRRLRAALCGGCGLAAILSAPAAMAQSSGVAVQEVIVTVQRRSERLIDVPMSVASLSSEALEHAGATNIHEIGSITPGVQVTFGGAYTQPAIRGVSSLTSGIGNENNVATYVDGFYVSDTSSINMDLGNISSIQVLKGPQGTLYGRNATGGAILINTIDPTKELTGKIEASYARFDEKALTGYVSGPLGDRMGFVLSAARRDGDGWLKLTDPRDVNKTTSNAAPFKQESIRAKLAVEVTEGLKATLGYNYALISDGTTNLYTPFEHVPSFLPGGNLRARRFGTASYNHDNINRVMTNEGTLKIELATPIGKLTSYSGYNFRKHRIALDFDGSYADITYADSPWRQRSYQQSVDYVIDAVDRLDLVVGGTYFNDRFGTDPIGGQRIYGANLVVATRSHLRLKTEAYGVYADATYKLTDALSVSAGGRYSEDHRYFSQLTTTGAGATTVPFYERRATFKRFTPRVSVRYEVAPRANVYATFSKGFRSGSFNPNALATAALQIPIKPEDIRAVEVGFKTAQSNYRFEVAAYHYDYKNLNVSLVIPNPICPVGQLCGPVVVIGNAPKAKVYGVDGQFAFTPLERLNVTVGAAWMHARYGKFPNAIGTGLNLLTDVNIPGQAQDWTGKQMSRAPNFSANLNVDYTLPLAGGELLVASNLAYSDSYVISNPSLYGPTAGVWAARQRFRQASTILLNARADWTDPSGHYTLGVFGKNLTNTNYRLSYNGANFGDYSSKGAPVTYGVRVGYKF